MIKHTPSFRRWVNRIAIFSLSTGLLTMAIIFFLLSKEQLTGKVSCEDWIQNTITPLEFEVAVLGIDKTDSKKCNFEIELSGDTPHYLRACQCPEGNNFTSWVEKGDSIFKKSEEPTLYVKKKDGNTRSFDYPCCE